jgi:putative membrane protein
MIVRKKPNIFRLFVISRGSIIGHVAPQLLAITFISMAVTWGERIYPEYFSDFTIAPFSILGLALSIFLGFRNNACYDRWWEARKQWGQLLVETRSAAREFVTLVASPDAEDQALRQRFLSCCIAFAAALEAQLRRQTPDVSPWLDPQDAAAVGSKRNVADAILRVQASSIVYCLRTGRISSPLYQTLEMRLVAMSGIQAACERIATTPLPFAYTLLVHRTAYLFCILLPFGLVATMGLATPLIAAITAYTFFGLDALGDELEEPFGASENAVPMDSMVRLVEISVLEAAGQCDLPEPLEAIDYVLR